MNGLVGHAPIRVLVADDDPDVLASLGEVIATDDTLHVVGLAGDAEEAIRMAAARRPHVAVIDWRMPRGGGSRAIQEIRAELPGVAVIAWSVDAHREAVLEMLQAGASSYLVKGSPIAEIIQSVHHAARGGSTLSREVAGSVVDELATRLRASAGGRRRVETRSRIRGILAGRALTMAFQPIYDLQGGSLVGVEGLARFATRPIRPPDEWFAEAAACGLGADLEMAAIRLALDALGELPSGAYLSVNASPAVAGSVELRRELAYVDPTRIVVEITEQSTADDDEAFIDRLAELRRLGVRLAIDDAGSGFANFGLMLRMAPDLIKLDRELCRDIHLSPAKMALARGLVGFGKASGAAMVAEGLETWPEVRAVREAGIRYAQGYRLSRPGPLPPEPLFLADLPFLA